jgi:hypothetical protein
MSRSASLLGNTVWIALTVATCLYPCLPARDPNGDVFALSRFDFALIYLASPEALWLQWTAGLPLDYWAVRGTSFAIAVGWMVILSLVGFLCLGRSRRHLPLERERRLILWTLRLVLGYSILRGVFYIQEWLLTSVSWPISLLMPTTLLMFAGIFGASYLLRTRLEKLDSTRSSNQNNEQEIQPTDLTLNQSWKRRLYGLATLSCLILITLHIIGAMIPSVDIQVRNQKWVPTTYHYKQATAPNESIHSEEGDASKLRFGHVGQLDPIAYLSMVSMQRDVRDRSRERNESTNRLDVGAAYPALLASKLVDIFVGIAGLLLLWGRAKERSGSAPAMLMLMLLLATPATLELGRLGRMEWIATSQIAAIIAVSSLRRILTINRPWLLISVLSVPLLEWCLSLSIQPIIPEADRWDAILRFIGFSTLFTIPWVACLVIGIGASPTRLQITHAAVGVGLFMVLSIIFNAPDRSWIPVLSFFALPVASGASWLLNNQNRFVGLFAWCGIMIVSLANASYWPTMENRILAPMEWLVAENWLEYGEAQDEVRTRYPIEFAKQLRAGTIEPNSKVLLLGTLDDIDIPIDCVTMPQTQELSEATITTLLERWNVTHIGFVSHPESSDPNHRVLNEADERLIRSVLERLSEKGALQKQSVSSDCFDLTLFELKK